MGTRDASPSWANRLAARSSLPCSHTRRRARLSRARSSSRVRWTLSSQQRPAASPTQSPRSSASQRRVRPSPTRHPRNCSAPARRSRRVDRRSVGPLATRSRWIRNRSQAPPLMHSSMSTFPILIGTNTDEYRLWLTPDAVAGIGAAEGLPRAACNARARAAPHRAVRDAFPEASPGEQLGQIVTDRLLRAPATRLAQARTAPTFVYEFAWESPVRDLRAAHALDIAFAFDLLEDDGRAPPQRPRRPRGARARDARRVGGVHPQRRPRLAGIRCGPHDPGARRPLGNRAPAARGSRRRARLGPARRSLRARRAACVARRLRTHGRLPGRAAPFLPPPFARRRSP